MNGYITLDYELFMGRAGTPENCLVTPMKYLCEMVDKYQIKMNIFVDAAYLLQLQRFKEKYPQLEKDWNTVVNNIKELEKQGHSIQLHLHPQWYYSTYDGEEWRLDYEHYKLNDMPLDEQKSLIHKGVTILNSILKHKAVAFRAGGYSIENFSDLYESFLSEGITIDSSVLPGGKSEGKFQSYDYLNIHPKSSYLFSYNHKLENKTGSMIEYPISTMKELPLVYLFKRILRKRNDDSMKIWGDGKSVGTVPGGGYILSSKLKQLLSFKAITANIEDGNVDKVFRRYNKEYGDFVIIGHPKLISPYTISLFESFIQKHPNIVFSTFKSV